MSADLPGLPSNIGRYELKGLIGRGGMGRVVRALDPVLKRDVALKLFEPASVAVENLKEARFMFHREARATAALRHPSILEVYDYSGPDAEIGFLACELLCGPTLRHVFEREGALPPEIVASLGHELASALAHAHAHGIIHRDLKPENIFWLEEGRVVLADFGIAKSLDGFTRLGNTVQFGVTNVYGSPAYMAPEQLARQEVGPQTDLHALGAILFEALTGEPAFDGPDVDAILQAVLDDERPVLAAKTDMPVAFVTLVSSLLAKAPQDRAASTAVVLRSLRKILDSLEVTDPRLSLRTYGDETEALIGDDLEPEAMVRFAGLDDRPAKIGAAELVNEEAKSPWQEHGPLLLGTLGLAIGLGVVAYLFVDLSGAIGHLQDTIETVPRTPTDRVTEGGLAMDVPVLIRFSGHGKVLVDGRDMGEADDTLRLRLAPGPHRLLLHHGADERALDVVVLEGTDPVFDFSGPKESGEDSATP